MIYFWDWIAIFRSIRKINQHPKLAPRKKIASKVSFRARSPDNMSINTDPGSNTEMVRTVDQYLLEGEISVHNHVMSAKERTQRKRRWQNKALVQFHVNSEVDSIISNEPETNTEKVNMLRKIGSHTSWIFMQIICR